ncbi:MAG: hypothetical protein J6M39_06795 [Lachnospiraceae bacterium]|nr:hypothetical protein [Lachnospiraceae bacterium]
MKITIEKLITVDESGMPKAPSVRQLLDKDVLSLYSRDNTPDKRRYIAECGVIYYLGDPKSPARQKGLSDAECLKEAIENFNLNSDYKPDDLVLRIVHKYYEQNITKAGVTIENLQRALHLTDLVCNKVLDVLNTKLRSGILEADIPTLMTSIDGVTKRIEDIPKLSKALTQAYENLRDEEESQTARGGVAILSSMDADEDF